MWMQNPAECFKTCRCCVPLMRSNSKSSDDVYSQRDEDEGQIQLHHTHRRTHSLPKDIQIMSQCQCSRGDRHSCSTAAGSVTNIYMSCCCSNSPFTPLAVSPSSPVSPHCRLSPQSTTSVSEDHHNHHISCTSSVLNSPVCDSEGRTFIAPAISPHAPEPQWNHSEAHSYMRARHRLVSYPSTCTHPGKILKHTHSSGEIHTRVTVAQPSVSDSQLQADAVEGVKCSSSQDEREAQCRREEVDDGQNVTTVTKDGEGRGEMGKGDKKRERVDVMHNFGCQLFDISPYNLVQRFYNSQSREAIILILASFFLYNGLRCILQTMCEDGGFHKVFTNADGMLVEATRRVAMLSLRILNVVISPLCLCIHISAIAAKPRIPKTSFSEEDAIKRMLCVHRNFSPHYEVKFIQNQPQSVFKMSEIMTKRHINSIWMSILNSLLFPALLGYIGGLKLSIQGVTEGGVCQFLSASVIHVPILDEDIHMFEVLDLLLSLGVVISIATLKDYYYYENGIAVFAVTVGGEAENLYKEIRWRWVLLDLYCYLTAGVILTISFALAYVKTTLLPDPSSMLQPEDLLNWCFWISVLSVVSFLGKSPNRLVKKTSFPAYILMVILINVANVRIDAIPPETMIVFFLISLSDFVVNLLLSLCSCHYHHFRLTRSRTSLFFLLLSLSLLILLPLTIAGTLYREVVHLATFVHW